MMDLKKWEQIVSDKIQSMTTEEFEKYFPSPLTPEGWISIEDHLPQCYAMDYLNQGYSLYKVRDKDGNEFYSTVSDHNIWYYIAKEAGITHWYNE